MNAPAGPTIRELLVDAASRLAAGAEDPHLEAQVLLAHALQRDRAWLFAWPEHRPTTDQAAHFADLIRQRMLGRPIAYLTGVREFWSLALHVDPHTLIPRPETEQLVEIALELPLPPAARVLDLGTGSGAIALALARERPQWRITAVDRSAAALAVARGNAQRLGLGRVEFLCSDWFDALPAQATFDLILSNPPYIAAQDPHLARGDLRFEPASALVSGPDGLDAIREIVAAAPRHLTAAGWLWLEHGAEQAEAIAAELSRHAFREVRSTRDLAGLPRHAGALAPLAKGQSTPGNGT